MHLVSDSGKYVTREAEVVSTPQDFTIRNDNGNIRKLEREPRLALEERCVFHCFVKVHWSDSAIRSGANKETYISTLADIIAALAPSTGNVYLRDTDIYKYSSGVTRLAYNVSVTRQSEPAPEVRSALSFYLPHDGRWIEEAVAKKVEKYRGGTLSKKLLLVIDGLVHLDSEQIEAFRATNRSNPSPFSEIWAVTMGKAYCV